MIRKLQRMIGFSPILNLNNLFSKRLAWLSLPLFLTILFVNPATRWLFLSTLSDAFWQVSSYVAVTLLTFYFISDRFASDTRVSLWLQSNRHFQVFFGASLGVIPGCGGAIVVITQFVRGNLTFGSVVAVLTATMGDAAFLLLVSQPANGFLVLSTSFVVAIGYGLLIDTIHRNGFMMNTGDNVANKNCTSEPSVGKGEMLSVSQGIFWKYLLIPAFFVAA